VVNLGVRTTTRNDCDVPVHLALVILVLATKNDKLAKRAYTHAMDDFNPIHICPPYRKQPTGVKHHITPKIKCFLYSFLTAETDTNG
jgi:hypothetical protein